MSLAPNHEEVTSALVVGQTPPPIHGQAMMIQALLQAHLPELRLFHVPLDSSVRAADAGRFQSQKIWRMLRTVLRIFKVKLQHPEIRILYYAPGGSRLGLWRDCFILASTRLLFSRLVLHFHAGGFNTLLSSLSRPEQFLISKVLGEPDLAIHVCEECVQSSGGLRPKRAEVVFNAVQDTVVAPTSPPSEPPVLLFLGRLSKEKGIWLFLEAAKILLDWNCAFRLRIVGAADDEESLCALQRFVREQGLEERTEFLGELSGAEKASAYARSDIFCNPTFYPSESLPLTAIDAMRFGKPSVLSHWRGLISIAADKKVALSFPIQNPRAMAEQIRTLLDSPQLREEMGRAARLRYLENHTLQKFHSRFSKLFREISERST